MAPSLPQDLDEKGDNAGIEAGTYKPFTPLGSLVALIGGSLNTTPTLTATTKMRVQ